MDAKEKSETMDYPVILDHRDWLALQEDPEGEIVMLLPGCPELMALTAPWDLLDHRGHLDQWE